MNSAANLEVVAEKVTDSLDKEAQEDFHEFLAVVPGDEDSCVIIMKRADYIA